MSRKAYMRYMSVQVPTPEIAARYFIHMDKKTLSLAPETYPPLNPARLFGDDRPIHLEIGCGTGEFACALAEEHPQQHFLGLDIAAKPLYKAIEYAVERDLSNIKFIHADFNLMYPLWGPASLQKVYLHYPVPNEPNRFRARRIFTQTFLDLMSTTLAPEGQISVVTDHAPSFWRMLELVEKHPAFEKTHAERHLVGFQPPAKSRFHRLWERYGVSALRFEVRRRPA